MKVWVVIEIEEFVRKEMIADTVSVGQAVKDLKLFKKEADARKCVSDLYAEYRFFAENKNVGTLREIVVPPSVEEDSFCDCGGWLNYMTDKDAIDYKIYIKECEVEKW